MVAAPNLRGGRIDLRFDVRTSTPDLPALSLLRRRWAFPEHPADGSLLLDTEDSTDGAGVLWARIERRRFVASNTNSDGGLVVLELSAYFSATERDVPARVRVRGPATDGRQELFGATLRVEHEASAEGDGLLRFFDALGEQGALRWASNSVGSSTVTWSGRARAYGELPFHVLLVDVAEARTRSGADGTRLHRIGVRRAGRPLWDASIGERRDADTGEWVFGFEVADRSPARIAPEVTDLEPTGYYYRVFGSFEEPATPAALSTWRAYSTATARHGFAADRGRPPADQHRLYQLLPAVLRRLDEPAPGDGPGQLRSFSEIFGTAFDGQKSYAEGLRARHDLREVRADFLRQLAHYVGWPLDLTKDAITQRFDVSAATQVFQSVGTATNLRALINRATGRDVEFKEFIHNVAFTNAVEPIRLWDIWQMEKPAGGAWREPSRPSVRGGVQARPALHASRAGAVLTWHCLDTGRWRVHVSALGGGELSVPGPLPLPLALPLESGLGELDPCIVPVPGGSDDFFIISAVEKTRTRSDLFIRRIDGAALTPRGPGVWLTQHASENRFPAAVSDGSSACVIWQSNRSGSPALWKLELAGDDPARWALEPQLFTEVGRRDEMPSIASDPASGRLWVVWSRDEGDRAALWWRRREAGVWTATERLGGEPGSALPPRCRDRSPALACSSFGGSQRLHCIWQSDRPHPAGSGVRRQRLWARDFTLPAPGGAGAWSEPSVVTDSATADEEPALLAAASGALTLVWSSRRRGKSTWTRSIDTADEDLLAHLGHYSDRAHYTYDTGRTEDDWFAGDTVGLFFEASDDDAEVVRRQIERMKSFVEPFRPAHVRFVWHMPRRTRLEELVSGARDELRERLMAWLHTWSEAHPEGRTVDAGARPVDIYRRIYDARVDRMSRARAETE